MPDEQKIVILNIKIKHGWQLCYIEDLISLICKSMTFLLFVVKRKIAICHFVRLRLALFGVLILDECNMVCYRFSMFILLLLKNMFLVFKHLNGLIAHSTFDSALFCVMVFEG
jgi:hypothetical protein